MVVEGVERIMEEEGLSPYKATRKAMKELTGALVATSLVLGAVFVPVSFLPGITGMLYRQFAITIVVSVLISLVVALTLSPAMCAILLRPSNGKKNFVFRKINEWLARGNNKYVHFLQRALANPRRIIACLLYTSCSVNVLTVPHPWTVCPATSWNYPRNSWKTMRSKKSGLIHGPYTTRPVSYTHLFFVGHVQLERVGLGQFVFIKGQA